MTLKLWAVLVVLGSTLVVSSAVANPPPNFSFGIHIGPEAPPPDNYDNCLPTRAILSELRSAGYRNFSNIDDSGDSLVLDASRGPRWYELDVDSCSGDVLNRSRIPSPY